MRRQSPEYSTEGKNGNPFFIQRDKQRGKPSPRAAVSAGIAVNAASQSEIIGLPKKRLRAT